MYIPAHFSPDEAQVDELLRNHGAADLVTVTPQGLVATMLPFVWVPSAGEHGSLHGHVARNNDQWKLDSLGEAMAIVRGPGDAYISPGFYPSKLENGRVVPTWNYVTAHVYGELVVHDDPVWVEDLVRRLTGKHEAYREHPWSVDDAPRAFVEGQLRAIVGVELVVSRIEAKAKLSQNRSAEDVEGVIAGLRERGDKEAADQAAVDAMRHMLDSVHMDGVVVIGEGEKDEAPMLANGEHIGDGSPPEVDIAVDPLEGTTLAAHGMPSALARKSIPAAPVSAQKPPEGLSLVRRIPIVRTMRQPPVSVPRPMAV